MQFEFNFKEKGMKLISFSAILRLNARILPQKDVINYLSFSLKDTTLDDTFNLL